MKERDKYKGKDISDVMEKIVGIVNKANKKDDAYSYIFVLGRFEDNEHFITNSRLDHCRTDEYFYLVGTVIDNFIEDFGVEKLFHFIKEIIKNKDLVKKYRENNIEMPDMFKKFIDELDKE